MQPHSLLDQQKRAAARSAHCHDLARLRTLQGCLGTAKFYQFEAARLHGRACELRDQIQNPQPLPGLRILNVVITDYIPPANPVTVDMSVYGSKPLSPAAFDGFFKPNSPGHVHVFIGKTDHKPHYIVGERG